jgi:methyl-accepting chemotaxis protein
VGLENDNFYGGPFWPRYHEVSLAGGAASGGGKDSVREKKVNIEAPREFLDRRQLVSAFRSLRRGDFSIRLPDDLSGSDAELAQLFNEVVGLNEQMTEEFERLSKVVGKEGKINQRGRVKNATGGWESAIRSINELIEDMVQPTAEVARVIGAVAKGDLSQSMTVEIDGRPLRGEFLRIGKVVNTMVEQLRSFAAEVTRVAREVATEGRLGGQAVVPGVAGTWKDLTDNVNQLAANLTTQVRNIGEVTTAIARGDLEPGARVVYELTPIGRKAYGIAH